VLFTRKGVAKLTDFSLLGGGHLLRLIDSGVYEQVTPMYVSPELIRKEKATPRADIYSLGVTAYLMFTGRVPFAVDTLQKLYFCHLNVVPDHPSLVNPKCPNDLGDAILRMMDKDPAKRFENCDQLRIVLASMGRSRI
jgi:serine/threonine protein kinase